MVYRHAVGGDQERCRDPAHRLRLALAQRPTRSFLRALAREPQRARLRALSARSADGVRRRRPRSLSRAVMPVVVAALVQVDALLGRMTLEEKIGQMTQLTIGALPDTAHLREAIVHRHVGSILNVVDTALSLDGWQTLIREIQDIATNETRLGVPILYGIDFVHGANYTRGGTIFPHNIGMAATFDPDLIREAGEVTAQEALASGLPWNFAPVLDVGRQPLWPRFYETFGEDPYLAAQLGAAAVTGMQSSGRVAATMKHYVGYSAPRTGHDRTP